MTRRPTGPNTTDKGTRCWSWNVVGQVNKMGIAIEMSACTQRRKIKETARTSDIQSNVGRARCRKPARPSRTKYIHTTERKGAAARLYTMYNISEAVRSVIYRHRDRRRRVLIVLSSFVAFTPIDMNAWRLIYGKKPTTEKSPRRPWSFRWRRLVKDIGLDG